MKEFMATDENRQFIAISGGGMLSDVSDRLKAEFTTIRSIIIEDDEILIEVTADVQFGFSLKDLREFLQDVASVRMFAVDTEKPGQRIYFNVGNQELR